MSLTQTRPSAQNTPKTAPPQPITRQSQQNKKQNEKTRLQYKKRRTPGVTVQKAEIPEAYTVKASKHVVLETTQLCSMVVPRWLGVLRSWYAIIQLNEMTLDGVTMNGCEPWGCLALALDD